jgi:hypothetical protein
MSSGAVQGFRGCEPQQTSTSERVKYSKYKHETQQTPASGDTNSRKGLQVAGIQVFLRPPLDQESPGSPPKGGLRLEPGGATGSAASDFGGGAFPIWAVRSPPLLGRTMMVESQHAAAGQKPFTRRRCQLELYGYRVDARL